MKKAYVMNPEKISASEWEKRMKDLPEGFRAKCRHLRSLIPGGGEYLFSPREYACRGDALLDRLMYDNSPAALRLVPKSTRRSLAGMTNFTRIQTAGFAHRKSR